MKKFVRFRKSGTGFVLAITIATLLLGACGLTKHKYVQPHQSSFDVIDVKAIRNNRGIHQDWKTDTSQRIISLNELTVLLRRNAIRPLNNPRYIANSEAKTTLFGGQPVVVVKAEGQWYGIPVNILSYHEIVNDSIGNTMFSVAYCPLCNTTHVFNRKLSYNNKNYVLKFGTTGMLRMSNLVMWDEQTESWWQHLTAEGLVGTLAGAKLAIMPAKIISLNNFWAFYPDGKTMLPDEDSGQLAQYNFNPYVKYDSLGIKQPFLYFGPVDPRLPAMEYVVGLEKDAKHKVYPLRILKERLVINDKFGNENVVLFYDADMISNLDTREINNGKRIGSATVFNALADGLKLTFVADKNNFKDNETGSVWNFVGECIDGQLKGKSLQPEVYSLDFAFAYFAFYPDAYLFTSK